MIRQIFVSFSLAAALLSGCSTTLAPDVVPVAGFEADRYLGTWYEIARLENKFEKGLSKVTADYSLKDDGKIKVVNKGYNTNKGEWEEAIGKAVFVGDRDIGHLKVSFFGPFYGPYVVFELDENYQTSYVTNNDKTNLWYLSRKPYASQAEKDKFLSKINEMNFELEDLVWVDQAQDLSDRPIK